MMSFILPTEKMKCVAVTQLPKVRWLICGRFRQLLCLISAPYLGESHFYLLAIFLSSMTSPLQICYIILPWEFANLKENLEKKLCNERPCTLHLD